MFTPIQNKMFMGRRVTDASDAFLKYSKNYYVIEGEEAYVTKNPVTSIQLSSQVMSFQRKLAAEEDKPAGNLSHFHATYVLSEAEGVRLNSEAKAEESKKKSEPQPEDTPSKEEDSVEEAIEDEEKEEALEEFPYHKGGGYYVLSNGETVKGKEQAIAEEAELSSNTDEVIEKINESEENLFIDSESLDTDESTDVK